MPLGEPKDEEEDPERECTWGSYKITEGEI